MKTQKCAPGIFVVLAFLLCLGNLAHAQVPQKGTDATFDVATWNIQTFGGFPGFGPADEALQFSNVRTVIAHADIDLWAVQEMGPDSCLPSIADTPCFEILVDSLDGYEGKLATKLGPEGFVRVGFIFKTDVVNPRSVVHILDADRRFFSDRPPLQLEADVTVNGRVERMYFIVVHMQARTGQAEHARRQMAGQLLREYIDTHLSGEKVMVLGDFNDELTRGITSGMPSPYAAWVADTTYRFLSLPLEERGAGTFISFNSSIDHVVVTEALYPAYVEASAEVFTEVQREIDDYTSTTSDHLPLLVRFDPSRFSSAVALEPGTELPEQFILHANYPNPFNPSTVIPFELTAPVSVQLRIVDVLGRRVATLVSGALPAGSHAVTWRAETVPAGTYFSQLIVGDVVQTRPLTLVK